MTIELILNFLATYFAARKLNKLLDKQETIAKSIDAIISELQKKYGNLSDNACKDGDIVEDGLKKHHFTKNDVFYKGVIRLLFDEPNYNIKELCRELNEEQYIAQFQSEEVDFVISEAIQLARPYPVLHSTILLKETTTIKEDLNINANPGILVSKVDFISQYESASRTFATTLSNKFYFRDKEIEEGLEALRENEILLITGDAGVGKTKLCLELCDKFVEQNPDYTLLCLKPFANTDVSAYLYKLLKDGTQIILFADDVNRVSGHFDAILQYIVSFNKSLKIVGTVRNYAFESTTSKCKDFNTHTLVVEKFEKEDIKSILQSEDFGINDYCIDAIYRISKGNARLAIMCADLAIKKQNIAILNNVEDLYNKYYGDFYKTIVSDDELKVLGALSVFKTINRQNQEVTQYIYNHIGIPENTFWKHCSNLSALEIVDLNDNSIVKFSDQTFSTYVHYRVYFKDKLLRYVDILPLVMKYKDRISDSIIPVLNCFGIETVTSVVAPSIDEIWGESSAEYKLKLIEIFFPFILMKSLLHLMNVIDNTLESDEEYDFNPGTNDHWLYDMPKEIEILSAIAKFNREHSNSAFELMFRFVQKTKVHYPLFINTLKEDWKYTRHSEFEKYVLQFVLLEFLETKQVNDKNDILFAKTVIALASTFLASEIHDTEFTNNYKFTLHNSHLRLSKSFETLRKRYWDLIFNLESQFHNDICNLLVSGSISYMGEASDSILKFDWSIIVNKLNDNFDGNNFLDCYTVNKISNRFQKWLKEKIPFEFEYKSHLWEVYVVLRRNQDSEDWRESLKLRQQQLNEYCADFTKEDYIQLFDDVIEIRETLSLFENSNRLYESEKTILFAAFHNNFSTPIDLIQHLLITIPEVIEGNFIYAYLNSYNGDINELIDVIEKSATEPYKSIFLFEVFQYTPQVSIDKKHIRRFTQFIDNLDVELSLGQSSIEMIFTKYENHVRKSIQWNYMLDCLCRKIDLGKPLFIRIDALCVGLDITNNIDKLAKIFFYLLKGLSQIRNLHIEQIIIKLLSTKPKYIISYIDILEFSSNFAGKEKEYSFIWELESYSNVIDIYEEYIINLKNKGKYVCNPFKNLFSSQKNETIQINFLRERLTQKCNEIDVVSNVFKVVYDTFRSKHYEFIELLLSLTTNVDAFKSAEISPSFYSYCYSGSQIPLLESEIERFEEIKNIAKKQKPEIDYLHHIEYVDKLIDNKRKEIKDVRIREVYYDD